MFDYVKRLVGAVQLVNLQNDVEYIQVPVCYRVFLHFKISHDLTRGKDSAKKFILMTENRTETENFRPDGRKPNRNRKTESGQKFRFSVLPKIFRFSVLLKIFRFSVLLKC